MPTQTSITQSLFQLVNRYIIIHHTPRACVVVEEFVVRLDQVAVSHLMRVTPSGKDKVAVPEYVLHM